MPTVLREGPYSFIFFSSDAEEPEHIHVTRERRIAKFWLDPIGLAKNRGFAKHELRKIRRAIEDHRETIHEAWHEYFGA